MSTPRMIFLVGLLAAACATAQRSEPARVKDSAPEKAAALNTANRSLQLETEEQRWGIAAARERKEQQEREKAKKASPPASGAPVDLHGGPGLRPAADQTAR